MEQRTFHTATLLSDGRVLLVGGCSATEAEIFDPVTGSAAPTTGDIDSHRDMHTATLLDNGKVLITGGRTACTMSAVAMNTALLFDPENGTFMRTTGDMMRPRDSHGATLLPDGQVLLAGGSNQGSERCPDVLEVYDPNDQTFRDAADIISTGGCGGGDRHEAPILEDGKILLISAYHSLVEVYDPDTDVISPAGNVEYRGDWTVTGLANGLVLIAGGASPYGESSFALAELYDPNTHEVVSTIDLATPRSGHTATLLSSGQVLVTGGHQAVTGDVRTTLRSAELFIP